MQEQKVNFFNLRGDHIDPSNTAALADGLYFKKYGGKTIRVYLVGGEWQDSLQKAQDGQEGTVYTDHDATWDYKIVDGKWMTKKKNSEGEWLDISNNAEATTKLNTKYPDALTPASNSTDTDVTEKDANGIVDDSIGQNDGPQLNQANQDYIKAWAPDSGDPNSAMGDTSVLDLIKAIDTTVKDFKSENYYDPGTKADYSKYSHTNTTDQNMYINPEALAKGKKTGDVLMDEETKNEYYMQQFLDNRHERNPDKYAKVKNYDQDLFNATGYVDYKGGPQQGDLIEDSGVMGDDATHIGWNLDKMNKYNTAENYLTPSDTEGVSDVNQFPTPYVIPQNNAVVDPSVNTLSDGQVDANNNGMPDYLEVNPERYGGPVYYMGGPFHGYMPYFANGAELPKAGWGDSLLDWGQGALSVAGMIPGIGILADGANTAISGGRAAYNSYIGDDEAAKKHMGNMALNATAMIPGVGQVATATKGIKGATNVVKAVGDDAIKTTAKYVNSPSKIANKYVNAVTDIGKVGDSAADTVQAAGQSASLYKKGDFIADEIQGEGKFNKKKQYGDFDEATDDHNIIIDQPTPEGVATQQLADSSNIDMSTMAIGSDDRRAAYDAKGWAYDDTINASPIDAGVPDETMASTPVEVEDDYTPQSSAVEETPAVESEPVEIASAETEYEPQTMAYWGYEMPKAQNGLREFTANEALYDLQGRCYANCTQRNYDPEHDLSMGVGMSIGDQGDSYTGSGKVWGGYSFNPDIYGGSQKGLAGYVGANIGGRGSMEKAAINSGQGDGSLDPFANAVATLGWKGELEDSSSYKTYLRGRRGNPMQYGVGAYYTHPLMGNQGKTAGGYVNVGNVNLKGGYNLDNKSPEFSVGLGIPIRRSGGDHYLPKAQGGTGTGITYMPGGYNALTNQIDPLSFEDGSSEMYDGVNLEGQNVPQDNPNQLQIDAQMYAGNQALNRSMDSWNAFTADMNQRIENPSLNMFQTDTNPLSMPEVNFAPNEDFLRAKDELDYTIAAGDNRVVKGTDGNPDAVIKTADQIKQETEATSAKLQETVDNLPEYQGKKKHVKELEKAKELGFDDRNDYLDYKKEQDEEDIKRDVTRKQLNRDNKDANPSFADKAWNAKNRMLDSKAGQTFSKIGAGAVRIAKPLNRLLEMREENRQKENMQNAYLADNMFATTDMVSGSKGDYDINSGIFRADDKVISRQGKYGTELSSFIYAPTMQMKQGGSFFNDGGEAEIDVNMYKELIAAGADLEII
jgi:hypothetical protein